MMIGEGGSQEGPKTSLGEFGISEVQGCSPAANQVSLTSLDFA